MEKKKWADVPDFTLSDWVFLIQLPKIIFRIIL